MKRVVSVSLGSSKRNKKSNFTILGEEFELERRGTDGDMAAFTNLFTELDGKVDALGIGGADLYLTAGSKRYTFKEIAECVKDVKLTPIADGSLLKHTLEREAVLRLHERGVVDFAKEKVLLMSAVDRFGMAQALDSVCHDVIYGDLIFGIGVPIPIRSYAAVKRLAAVILPVITRLPFKWFYPTGEKQDVRTPKYPKLFADRTFLCGDSLYILRYAPDDMRGKTILTQSVRKQNLEWLKEAGTKRVIVTTPVVEGETFATNVMEAALAAYAGKSPDELGDQGYLELLNKIGWEPEVIELNP